MRNTMNVLLHPLTTVLPHLLCRFVTSRDDSGDPEALLLEEYCCRQSYNPTLEMVEITFSIFEFL